MFLTKTSALLFLCPLPKQTPACSFHKKVFCLSYEDSCPFLIPFLWYKDFCPLLVFHLKTPIIFVFMYFLWRLLSILNVLSFIWRLLSFFNPIFVSNEVFCPFLVFLSFIWRLLSFLPFIWSLRSIKCCFFHIKTPVLLNHASLLYKDSFLISCLILLKSCVSCLSYEESHPFNSVYFLLRQIFVFLIVHLFHMNRDFEGWFIIHVSLYFYTNNPLCSLVIILVWRLSPFLAMLFIFNHCVSCLLLVSKFTASSSLRLF